jgi:hypothetical protein
MRLSLLHIWFEAWYVWKICFCVKNSIYAKIYSCSMILMASSHIYFIIFITCPCTTHTHITHTLRYIYIYILLALRQNPLDIKFLYNFRNCQGNFHRTCPTPGPDMSGYRVSQIYKGDLIPFGTLASFFHPISSVCGGWALPRWFGASTKTPQFLGDLTHILLRNFKPQVVLSILRYSQGSPSISLIYCWFSSMLDLLTLEHL